MVGNSYGNGEAILRIAALNRLDKIVTEFSVECIPALAIINKMGKKKNSDQEPAQHKRQYKIFFLAGELRMITKSWGLYLKDEVLRVNHSYIEKKFLEMSIDC
jgi:hypothetical protein